MVADGKTIAGVVLEPATTNAVSALVAVNALSGGQTLIFASQGYLSQPAWLPDGSGLLALLRDKETNYDRNRIVEIPYPNGTPRAVTHDLGDYSGLSLSADGQTLAGVLAQAHYDVSLASAASLGNGQVEQLAPYSGGEAVYALGFSWTEDGQMIISPDYSLRLLNPESRSRTPLTSPEQDGLAFQPSACPNGRYAVFVLAGLLAGHAGAMGTTIWRMDSGGANLKRLSDGKLDQQPVCSPDGRWVFYRDLANDGRLNKIRVEGGKAEVVTQLPVSYWFDISPDGKLAAFATVSPGSPKVTLALVPVDSPGNANLLALQQPPIGPVRFAHDGKAVIYAIRQKDADNLWLQPLDGSPGKQITNFKSELIGDFRWSFDGSKLGLIRGHAESDVVLLRASEK